MRAGSTHLKSLHQTCTADMHSRQGGYTHLQCTPLRTVRPPTHLPIHPPTRLPTHQGFPSVGFEWQGLESPALRRSLGMSAAQKGVLLCRILPTAPAAPLLRAGDVLTAFDGDSIACDGTVAFRTGERISFGAFFCVFCCPLGHGAALRFGEKPHLSLHRPGYGL